MKRNIFLVYSALLFLFSINLHAQESDDLFLGNYRLGNSAELVLIWSEPDDNDSRSFQRIYDYISGGNLSLIDSSGGVSILEGNQGIAGNRRMDLITGNFYGDAADDIVAVWEGPDRTINMMIPFIAKDPLGIQVADVNPVPAAKLVNIAGNNADEGDRQVQLARGNFDNDGQDEFVMAYWAENRQIRITIYEVSSNIAPIARGTIGDVSLPNETLETVRGSQMFAISAGDLNNDRIDEVLLVAAQKLSCGNSRGCWQIMLRVYQYDSGTENFTVSLSSYGVYKKEANTSQQLERLALVSGDFDNDARQEIAVAYTVTDNNLISDYYFRTLKLQEDLAAVVDTVGEEYRIRGTNGVQPYPVSIAAEDLDRNGSDEIIVTAGNLEVFEADSLLKVRQIAIGDIRQESGTETNRSLVVADLDAEQSVADDDSLWSPELVVVSNWVLQGRRFFRMQVYGYVPGQFSLSLLAEHDGEFSEDKFAPRFMCLAAGDFTNASIQLGTPRRFTKTEVVEPIAIVNAPPTHFDVFDGAAFDVTQCYNDNNCDFVATYQAESAQTIEVETAFNSDWSVGASTSGGFKIPVLGIGAEVELEARYGRGFAKSRKTSNTFTVRQSVDATVDDWIYAIILDYDVWEYPLFLNGEIEGYVAVIIPSEQRGRAWFDSKSFSAHTYLPSHEVGNILSYREIAAPEENSFLAEAIRWDTGDRVTLSSNSRVSWTLTTESNSETIASFRESKFFGGSADFDIPFKLIPDFGIQGDYSTKKVSTYASRLTDRQGLSVNFDAIDLSFGNTRYSVTPYVYWAQNGALVLDYAVKPELPPTPADPPTWWSTKYGTMPDPTFILPWRNDEEKGLGLDEPAQKYRTRDILFAPPNPEPGDVVTIKARIQNFSLTPTQAPVEAAFYLGDPDSGGTRIVGVNGEDAVSTPAALEARSSAIVEMEWRLPNNIDRFNRIYAVLDRPGNIDEIHENNNQAWNVLSVESTTTVDETRKAIPPAFRLHQNYPNPFNPATEISYSIAEPSQVKLAIYNILGKEVVVLVDAPSQPGVYTVEFNANNFSSGLYFARLEAGNFREVRRMLLLR